MASEQARPVLRFDRLADRKGAGALLDETFGDAGQSQLLERLRDDGDLLFLLLAERAEVLVGAAAFSRVYIEGPDRDGAGVAAAALAPMAVRAAHQGQGVGTALARAGFAQCRRRGVEAVLALGHDRFLNRLGFTTEAARRVTPPWKGPELQALLLHDDMAELEGAARYPAAFDPRRRSAA